MKRSAGLLRQEWLVSVTRRAVTSTASLTEFQPMARLLLATVRRHQTSTRHSAGRLRPEWPVLVFFLATHGLSPAPFRVMARSLSAIHRQARADAFSSGMRSTACANFSTY